MAHHRIVAVALPGSKTLSELQIPRILPAQIKQGTGDARPLRALFHKLEEAKGLNDQ